ncbi:MAG: hypothetical protein ACREBU_05435 [Nitrososphaera sp.]
MKLYLVDENMSKPDKFIDEHREFENVKNAIEIGAYDGKIIDRAKSNNQVIITKDVGLALKALIEGVKVWFYDDKGNNYKLVATKF